MPIKKYANARPLGRDNTSDYSVSTNSDYSVNGDYSETINNIHNNTSDYSVNSDYSVTQAADLISTTLTKMSPAYKKGKERRQADPLGWRIEKLIRRLRPMLSSDRFLEITKEFATLDTMEKVALAHKLEEWLKVAHGGKGT